MPLHGVAEKSCESHTVAAFCARGQRNIGRCPAVNLNTGQLGWRDYLNGAIRDLKFYGLDRPPPNCKR